MKILLILLLLIYSSVNAGTLQKKTKSFFGGDNIVNIGTKEVKDESGFNESLYNIDFFGIDLILPHQPANDQFLSTVTGLGLTYKFSELLSIWGRYSFFTVKGVKLNGNDTSWEHKHYAGGLGYRYMFKEKNRIVYNVGLSQSEIKETVSLGTVKSLQTGVVADIKFLWTDDNLSYGPYLTITNVPSKATTWETHHKGGYTSIGLTLQMGIPGFNE